MIDPVTRGCFGLQSCATTCNNVHGSTNGPNIDQTRYFRRALSATDLYYNLDELLSFNLSPMSCIMPYDRYTDLDLP